MTNTEQHLNEADRQEFALIIDDLQTLGEDVKQLRESCTSWPLARSGSWYRMALLLGAASDSLWVVEQYLRDETQPQ